MPIAQVLLPEFDHEMKITRTVLERIPDAKASFRPHPRSWTLGELGAHLANLPVWGTMALTLGEFDTAPAGGPPRKGPEFQSTAELLQRLDANVAAARSHLAAASDADLMAPWSLKRGGATVFTLPRAAVLRSMVLSHMIHHRGQLTVYLRMCDVPLPPVYGPTADA
jgi:uncharacterized damage-inducible protein DinB